MFSPTYHGNPRLRFGLWSIKPTGDVASIHRFAHACALAANPSFQDSGAIFTPTRARTALWAAVIPASADGSALNPLGTVGRAIAVSEGVVQAMAQATMARQGRYMRSPSGKMTQHTPDNVSA